MPLPLRWAAPDQNHRQHRHPRSGIAWDTYKVIVAVGLNFTRTLSLPPGVPDNTVRAYWQAVESMIKDPEFIKAASLVVGQEAKWGGGESFQKAFAANFTMKPETTKWLRAASAKYGKVVE